MSRRLRIEADGGARGNPGPAGYGAAVTDAETGELLAERSEFLGVATNNNAEYRGLIAGLRAAAEIDPGASVEVRMDSKLVVEQMSGRWKVKHPDLRPLASEAAALVASFGEGRVRFVWIPRERNKHADRLANQAMDAGTVRGGGSDPLVASAVAAPALEDAARNRLVGWDETLAPPTTTVLMRHGRTSYSGEHRFSGVGDPPLTPEGREQAAASASRLAERGGITAIVSSPLSRCRDTARIVGDVLGLDVAVDDDWRETDFGTWEALTFATVQERWPEELAAWLADVNVTPPGGESLAATGRRVARAHGRLLGRFPHGRVLVVTHVTPIKSLVRMALDAPAAALWRLQIDNASLTEIDWYDDGPSVVRTLNDTAHVPPLTG